jgi:hypothetical protein
MVATRAVVSAPLAATGMTRRLGDGSCTNPGSHRVSAALAKLARPTAVRINRLDR